MLLTQTSAFDMYNETLIYWLLYLMDLRIKYFHKLIKSVSHPVSKQYTLRNVTSSQPDMYTCMNSGYRIAGKFGEDFNLAVWRIVKNRQIKFSPIIKHDVIRYTHAHGLSTLHAMCTAPPGLLEEGLSIKR